MTATTDTSRTAAEPMVPTPALSSTPVLAATAVGLALNGALEVAEAVLLPHLRGDLASNLALVTVWSLGGLVVGLGLLRLGRPPGRRTTVAWVAAVLALVTAVPMFWAAVPASLAGAGVALAAGRPGSPAAARVVSVVAFLAFVAVSIGMFPFTEV